MMGGGTADSVVFPSPGNFREELGDNKAFRSGFHMLTESPPTEIPSLLKFLVRALEDRDILFHELRSLVIGKLLDVNLLVCGIEPGHIL